MGETTQMRAVEKRLVGKLDPPSILADYVRRLNAGEKVEDIAKAYKMSPSTLKFWKRYLKRGPWQVR